MLALFISQYSISKYTSDIWTVSLTTAYNLMLSGIITIKNINIQTSALKQQQQNITDCLFFLNIFKSFIEFRNLGTIKTNSNNGHKILSKTYVHKGT
jgi:hypothetical protein